MRQLFPILLAALPLAAPAAEPPRLPDRLELRYALRYDTLTVGHVTKTLARQPDGTYLHRSHSVPEGMARWFTSVEWHEEGRFEVVDGARCGRCGSSSTGLAPTRHTATRPTSTGRRASSATPAGRT
ncbi:MAG: hypothetical protein MZW92_46235 [Comamonadaceae bacterium]|nr:hypothetical protein [Comamonadaceae bacterium]